MDIEFREVHTPLWEDRIVAFDERMARAWICDVAAVGAGYGHVRREAIREFLRRPESTVVVALRDRTEVVGYVVGDELDNGGCRGRWLGAWPQPGLDVSAVLQGLLDTICDRYGWMNGRITNPILHAALVGFGCVPTPDDPTLLTYRKD